MTFKFLVPVVTILIFYCFDPVISHGRLMEPPSRSSLWRFEEFKKHDPPINYNDNELNCGGKDVQYNLNMGYCGECGDNWATFQPRENENGGRYGKGIISRRYKPGQNISVQVELTAPHLGHFEFKLCPLSNEKDIETQSCFDQTTLLILQDNGQEFNTSYYIDNLDGWIDNLVKLPPNFQCERCSFLWYYKTGNSWGDCEDGSSGIGCGPQEEFRGCADISILP